MRRRISVTTTARTEETHPTLEFSTSRTLRASACNINGFCKKAAPGSSIP